MMRHVVRLASLLCAGLVLTSVAPPLAAQTPIQQEAEELAREERLLQVQIDILQHARDAAGFTLASCRRDEERNAEEEDEDPPSEEEIARLCAVDQQAYDAAVARLAEIPALEERLEPIRVLRELAQQAALEESIQAAFPGLNTDILGGCVNTLRGLGVQPEDDTFFDALRLCYAVESASSEPVAPPPPAAGVYPGAFTAVPPGYAGVYNVPRDAPLQLAQNRVQLELGADGSATGGTFSVEVRGNLEPNPPDCVFSRRTVEGRVVEGRWSQEAEIGTVSIASTTQRFPNTPTARNGAPCGSEPVVTERINWSYAPMLDGGLVLCAAYRTPAECRANAIATLRPA